MAVTRFIAVVLLLVCGNGSISQESTRTQEDRRLLDLSVIFAGTPGSDRTRAFEQFLLDHFSTVQVVDRDTWNPQDGAQADVVVLDWPQEREPVRKPLGELCNWSTPTVLLGSAGMNLGRVWNVKGGYGCTCLYPYAMVPDEHPVLESPRPFDASRPMELAPPGTWTQPGNKKDKAAFINSSYSFVSLIRDELRGTSLSPGWCENTDDFATSPELEVILGGYNTKAPGMAAIWRQGNLLHFGFENAPSDLNNNGQTLLVNSIAYISRFGDDKPYFRTQQQSREGRRLVMSIAFVDRFRGTKMFSTDSLKYWFESELLKSIPRNSDADFWKWFDSHRPFLTNNPDGLLVLEDGFLDLENDPRDSRFLEQTISRLGDDKTGERARSLLARYRPVDSPDANAGQIEWQAWIKRNRPYLFWSESSGNRWLIDDVARRRQIPTSECRGVKRASRPGPEWVDDGTGAKSEGQAPETARLQHRFRQLDCQEPDPSTPVTAALHSLQVEGQWYLGLRVRIMRGWQIYARLPKQGTPFHETTIDLSLPDDVKQQGSWWLPNSRPSGLEHVELYEGDLVFVMPVRPDEKVMASGQEQCEVTFGFQACNDLECGIPEQVIASTTLELPGSTQPGQEASRAIGYPIAIEGDGDTTDLHFLKEVLRDKRIVLLGESNHGSREFNLQKNRLIRYLHEELGYSVLLLESGLGEMYSPNYSRSELAASQMVGGGVIGPWRTHEYLKLMQYVKEKDSLSIGGFDVQRSGQSFAAVFQACFDEIAIGSVDARKIEVQYATVLKSLRNRNADLSNVEAEYNEATDKYNSCLRLLDQSQDKLRLSGNWSPEQIAIIQKTIENRVLHLAYFRQFRKDNNFSNRFAARDKAMADNILLFASKIFPDQKIVVSAHNYHIARNNRSDIVMGELLAKEFGETMYSIGFFAGGGEFSNDSRASEKIEAPVEPNNIRQFISGYSHESYFIDIPPGKTEDSEWLFDDVVVDHSFLHLDGTNTLVPAQTFDGLVLISNVSPVQFLRQQEGHLDTCLNRGIPCGITASFTRWRHENWIR